MIIKYFILFLLGLIVHADGNGFKCKRELIDSHNIMSYPEPNKGKLVLCPHIKQSCIPSFEQFKIFGIYTGIVKPHYELTRDVIKIELTLLNKMFKGIITNMLTKVTSIKDEGARIQAIDLLERLKKKKIDKIMKTAISEHSNAHRYMINMKTAYLCVIGDYNYHRHIDTERKKYVMTDSSCDDLVKNTIVYSNAINRGIIPFLENLLTVHQKITNKEDVLRLAGSSHISKSVKECADEYKISDESLSSCRKYCSFFRLNADSPAFEGYPEFFANVLWELKDYNTAGGNKADSKSRILGEKMEKLLKSTRRLEETNGSGNDFVDPFDADKLRPIDLFEVGSVDPDFDDAAMVEAFKVQQLLTKGENFDATSVVRKHYIDEYEVPMDDLESSNIFNVPSHARVDVSEYQGEVLVSGIDFPTILKDLNWNMTIDEIAKAILTGKKSGQKELVDPLLIIAINDIDNRYVKKFHADVHMDFKELKFKYRIKQLKQKGQDSLFSDRKTTDETISIVSEIVKNNETDSAKADKLINEITLKLKKDHSVNTSGGDTNTTSVSGNNAGIKSKVEDNIKAEAAKIGDNIATGQNNTV